MSKERYSFRLSKQSYEFLVKQAERNNMSISMYLDTLLMSLLARAIRNENA